ncbi:MAG: YdcF family protein [Crocinitomicaceae bacterium]|jgi:SanA protein|nr:YdcF family protein [Crocinitomicaceae bacterium]
MIKKYFTRKRIFFGVLLFSIISAIGTLLANSWVESYSKEFIPKNMSDLPNTKVGLLLGTARLVKGGRPNAYFYLRIKATVKLYEAGKIKYVLISGDNSRKDYSEPQDMMDELVARGIPASRIYLDYAGFRTLDSILRANKIFGQEEFIVISQRFHNERAIFIGRKKGLKVWGYNARDVRQMSGLKTKIREWFARDKVFIDLLFNVQPKFYGDPISIP